MQRERYYRNFFVVAALWNWIATVPFFFAYGPIFAFLGMSMPIYPGNLQLFLSLAFVFGIGYYWVSRNLMNLEIVKMGIVGKIFVFLLLLYYSIIGNIPWLLVLPGIVDLIFAILFIEYLLRVKRGA
jgi:hypothetical protein